MRIGIIKSNFSWSGGGSERYTNGLIAQLLDRGHQVEVLTARWDAAAASTGVVIHRVPMIRGPSFLRALSFALNCRRTVERADCDLVLSVERTIRQDICRAGGGCHKEWLIQRRRHRGWAGRQLVGLNPLHAVLLWIEKRSYSPKNTRAIIANSHRGKEEIIRHYRFPAERIHVVHNGTDCDRFKPPPEKTSRGETVLIFAGSGFERKGLEFAIRALALLPVSVRLEVAGKGDVPAYRRVARRLGVDGRVKFLGSEARMEEVYARGDILVHPAIYEPFSNTCLEALACGLPVITSRINGASEIIQPGENGAIVENPADVPVLAAAIELFLEVATRDRARIEARRTAEALPMALNVERTLAVIEMFRREGRAAIH